MEKTDIKVKHYMRYTEMSGWLLLPGVALLFTEVGLASTRLRRLP